MGSPNSDGRISRGRYLYLSKNSGDFFPYLSQTVLNDTILLPVTLSDSKTRIYAKFVYHNSKFSVLNPPNSPRNEYRLYLNNELDLNKTLFKVDDIVVIEKVSLVKDSDNLGFVYSISIFNTQDNNYLYLLSLLKDYSLTGNNLIFEGQLNFVIRPNFDELSNVIISDEIKTIAIAEQKDLLVKIDNETDTQGLENIRGANLFNSVSFRDFVLLAYEYKCAVTREVICYKDLNNLEAAHIQPKAHSGTYLPCNGLALSRDMHWAFDKGFFSLSDDFTIIVHDDLRNSILYKFNGKEILVPKEPYFQPEKKFLKYHRDNVFGLFKYSGSIRSL